MDCIFATYKNNKNQNWTFYKLKEFEKEFEFLQPQKVRNNWSFRELKKLKKTFSESCSKNYNKFEFPKVFDLKDIVNLLSTYRHEKFQNIFSWQAEKNILLSTYWHKKHDDFHKILDPVFDKILNIS